MPLFKKDESEKILSNLKGFLPKSFLKIGDSIISYFEEKKAEEAIATINLSVGLLNAVEVSIDLIFRQNETPLMQKNAISTVGTIFDMPKYIVDGVRNNEISFIKLTSEDIEHLYAERNIGMENSTTWDKLTRQTSSGSTIRFTDRVFYTLVEFCSQDGTSVNKIRYGVINDIPQDKYSEIYPFKCYEERIV